MAEVDQNESWIFSAKKDKPFVVKFSASLTSTKTPEIQKIRKYFVLGVCEQYFGYFMRFPLDFSAIWFWKEAKLKTFAYQKSLKRKLEYAIKNKSLKCIGTNRKEIPQRLRNWTRTTGTENLPKLPMAIKIFSPFKAPKYKVLCWHLRHLKISRFNCLRPTPFLPIQG